MDIIFLIIFSALIGYWANNWGRNGWLWFFIALLISPLITAIILLVMGRDGIGFFGWMVILILLWAVFG
jgi:hypothetical protein